VDDPAQDLAPELWDDKRRLQYLLDHWSEICDPGPLRAMNGRGGERDTTPMMPEVAHHPSVVELDRCLLLLATVEPIPHAHLKAYRVSVEWKIGPVLVRRRLPSGKRELVYERRRLRRAPAWVDLDRVAQGENWLEAEFDGPVDIPKPFWRALTEPAGVA